MRFEVLSHIVIKCIVGFFMIAQSLYNIVTYETYISNMKSHLTSTILLNNDFFYLMAPLFPFVEFGLGFMIILEVYFRETAFLSILFLGSTTILYLIVDYSIVNTLIMLLFSILSIWLFVSRVTLLKYKNFSYL